MSARVPSVNQADPGYKWIALSNTTIGILMATLNSSIVLISLPAVFRGIGLNPLTPQNVSYLLWMLMGYMVVTAVLVVSLGRVGDIYGRVKMYNLGFAVFTVASIGLSLVFWTGPSAALTLIGGRIVQGVGGALLMANSAAILTDAFPENQRGMALGINSVAGIGGSFIGLLVGGLLATYNWHLVFLVSVPVGVLGTVWAFFMLREVGTVQWARMDWLGNLTFGVGLILILVGITYGIQPYGSSDMGWTNLAVQGALVGGVVLLILFGWIETRVEAPMFRLSLFKIPAFAAGNIAGLLASVGRGGLMFMLIIWLQGIWLPLHGVSFEQTPLWAAICMLPMTAGFLIAGPVSGYLSDRFGARPFATGGMIAAALTFALMLLLPADFAYLPFGLLLLANGLAMGLFSAPNTAGIMNAVPPGQRGVASGMRATFQNAGMNLSVGLFFSLMVAGLARSLPGTLRSLTRYGVPPAAANHIAALPPVGSLFAAFLGYNPMRQLLGPLLAHLPSHTVAYLTGRAFFPNLISGPFMDGMHITFLFSMAMMLVAAGASWLRGGKYVHREAQEPALAAASSPPGRPATLPPPVVAISGAYGAAATEIGRELASRLDVPFIDRAIPGRVAERLAQPLLQSIEREQDGDGEGLVRVLSELSNSSPLFGVNPPSGSVTNEETYRREVAQAIVEIASQSGCVIVGHGAAIVLRGHSGALLARLYGPPSARLDRAMVMEKLDANQARSRLKLADQSRAAFLHRMYGRDPDDPELYHVMLDTTALPVNRSVELLLEALDGRREAAFRSL